MGAQLTAFFLHVKRTDQTMKYTPSAHWELQLGNAAGAEEGRVPGRQGGQRPTGANSLAS